MTAAIEQSSPLLKQLASSNTQTRREALETLRLYLSRRARFSDLELLKLWKGLFYCMWMSDRPPAQQRLARDLAALVDDTLSEENALPFLDAFWKTMAREWGGIDVLRMDKFLFLVRQELAAGFRFCARGGKGLDIERTKTYMKMLETTPLNVEVGKVPDGLKYHTLDVYVDELDKVDDAGQDRDGRRMRFATIPLETLLEPVTRMQKKGPMKALRNRAMETLEDGRLKDWYSSGKATSEEREKERAEEGEEEEEFSGFGD